MEKLQELEQENQTRETSKLPREVEFSNDCYITFNQAAKRYTAFTEGSLRWMRFNNTGGFNRCVRKVGKKLLLSIIEFERWLDSQTAA